MAGRILCTVRDDPLHAKCDAAGPGAAEAGDDLLAAFDLESRTSWWSCNRRSSCSDFNQIPDGTGVSQCQGKWPDQTLDHRARCPEVLVAAHPSHLDFRQSGKLLPFTSIRGLSGESQFGREP